MPTAQITSRQIDLVASEAAKCRAMSMCHTQLRKTWLEVAEALELAVEMMNERMAAQQNESRRHC